LIVENDEWVILRDHTTDVNNNGGDHSSVHLLYQNLRWKLDEERAKYLILGKSVSYDDGVNGRYTCGIAGVTGIGGIKF
jgi:hypothetical protein